MAAEWRMIPGAEQPFMFEEDRTVSIAIAVLPTARSA